MSTKTCIKHGSYITICHECDISGTLEEQIATAKDYYWKKLKDQDDNYLYLIRHPKFNDPKIYGIKEINI